MPKFTPYEVFEIHTGLKSHFTSNFDYTTSTKKIRDARVAFAKRSDRYFFEKVSFGYRDPERLIVATAAEFLPTHAFPTIVECTSPLGVNALVRWDRITQSLQYEIEKWLISIEPEINQFNDIFSWNNKQSPRIFRAPRAIAAVLNTLAPAEFEQNAHVLAKPYIKLFDDLSCFVQCDKSTLIRTIVRAIGPKYDVTPTSNQVGSGTAAALSSTMVSR